MGRADNALYKAKQTGRNRVATEEELIKPPPPGVGPKASSAGKAEALKLFDKRWTSLSIEQKEVRITAMLKKALGHYINNTLAPVVEILKLMEPTD